MKPSVFTTYASERDVRPNVVFLCVDMRCDFGKNTLGSLLHNPVRDFSMDIYPWRHAATGIWRLQCRSGLFVWQHWIRLALWLRWAWDQSFHHTRTFWESYRRIPQSFLIIHRRGRRNLRSVGKAIYRIPFWHYHRVVNYNNFLGTFNDPFSYFGPTTFGTQKLYNWESF